MGTAIIQSINLVVVVKEGNGLSLSLNDQTSRLLDLVEVGDFEIVF